MFKEALARAGRRFLLFIVVFAMMGAFLVYQHKDDPKPAPKLAKGTPLSVYRMRCKSSGRVDGEEVEDWKNYLVSYNPTTQDLTVDANGKHTKLPPAQIAAEMPEYPNYFIALTQPQLNTAEGVTIVNVQAVLPMKAGMDDQPLGFQVSVPHGQAIRADACTAID